jgi:hypothetical protein
MPCLKNHVVYISNTFKAFHGALDFFLVDGPSNAASRAAVTIGKVAAVHMSITTAGPFEHFGLTD